MKTESDQWQVASDTKNVVPPPGRSCHLPLATGHPLRAFTLIEILVAMAIFGIVVAAIYSTWILILRASQMSQNTAAQVQRQRVALRTLEYSLTCIQSFQASMKYYGFTAQSGDQPELSFTARLPDVFPLNRKYVNPELGRDYSLRRLTFSLAPGRNGENDLVLRQNPVLMELDAEERQMPLVLARGVKKFNIECWDPQQKEWVDGWENTNNIPAMVRISLVLSGSTEPGSAAPDRSVTRLIAVPSITLPSVLQIGR